MVKFDKALRVARRYVAPAEDASTGREGEGALPWIPYKELKKNLKAGASEEVLFGMLRNAAADVDAAFAREASTTLARYPPVAPSWSVCRALNCIGNVVLGCRCPRNAVHDAACTGDSRLEAVRSARKVRLYAKANATAVRKILKKIEKVRPELAPRCMEESRVMHAGLGRDPVHEETVPTTSNSTTIGGGGGAVPKSKPCEQCMFMYSPLLVDLWALEERSVIELSEVDADAAGDVGDVLALERLDEAPDGGTSFRELRELPRASSDVAETAAKLDEQLQCAICLDVVHNAFCLACGHYACMACLAQTAKLGVGHPFAEARDSAKCPQCRRPGVFKGAKPLPQLDLLVRERIGEVAYKRRKRLADEQLDRLREAEELADDNPLNTLFAVYLRSLYSPVSPLPRLYRRASH